MKLNRGNASNIKQQYFVSRNLYVITSNERTMTGCYDDWLCSHRHEYEPGTVQVPIVSSNVIYVP